MDQVLTSIHCVYFRCYILDITLANTELFMSGPIDVNIFISAGKL
jgi:hypothetical protein